jgi:RimJ/RimL family protein N-acetyltransferase
MRISIDETLEIAAIQDADQAAIEAALALDSISGLSILSPHIYKKKERVATQFSIRLNSNLIGAIGMERGTRQWGRHYSVELSFWILPSYQQQGIMSKVLPVFIEKIIGDWYVGKVGYPIITILCSVLGQNIAAQRLISKFGFDKKAELKEFVNKNGTLHDQWVYERLIDRDPFSCNYPVFGSFHLRPLRYSDAEASHHHRSNPKVVQFLASSAPLSFQESYEFIVSRCDPDSLHLAICENDALIGLIGLSIGEEDYESHLGEIGYWMAEEYWGKGIMSKVIQVFLDDYIKGYVIPVLGYPLKRVCAFAIETNVSSRRILEKNGFEYHGCTTKTFWKVGKLHNDVYYSRSI